jgi:hypothetical protein
VNRCGAAEAYVEKRLGPDRPHTSIIPPNSSPLLFELAYLAFFIPGAGGLVAGGLVGFAEFG